MGNGHSELCEIYECIALHEWEIYVGKIIYSIIIYPFNLSIRLEYKRGEKNELRFTIEVIFNSFTLGIFIKSIQLYE